MPHQPDHTHQKDEEEGDYCRDDSPSVDSDQRVQLLELANKRLTRENKAMESTLTEYNNR